MSSDSLLTNLNPSQRAAVSSTAQTLAILAGPGSGKTHTLTSRTAWLLRHEGLQPWNIIVATFTVKAAREMKERIGKLIGDGMESKLILGTFHSIARRYLARYGHLIDIPKDFGIADSADSLAIIKRIIKRHRLTIEAPAARSRISSKKAKGGGEQPPAGAKLAASKALEMQDFETCYTEYEDALKRSNLLDYDDLLLRCVDLLRLHPSCVSNVEAVLIDEFQDTNLVQFDLMRLFASQRKKVTIVGDPDQSIYGFRSAETKNFKRMLVQYPDTVTIPLEENYRSSGAILLASLEVIQQDESRIAKSLMPTHTIGTCPVLRRLSSAHVEGEWIVSEIRRSITLTGSILNFDDVAILLRSAALSRHIESALGKTGIAYRMVGGHRFYDRIEVKIILDYMRVISQPDNNDAVARVVNVPSRRIGETTIKALLEEADQSSMTLWTLIFESVQGRKNTKTKVAKQTEQGLSSFVNIILSARKKIADPAETESCITELIDFIIKKISFEDYLEKSHPEDHEGRWANVQELINLASDFGKATSDGYDDDALPEVDGIVQDEATSYLSKFLANIALASDAKASDSDGPPKPQVTISTIHAAKGLEWPVVFIPAAYEGSIPHSRAEDSDEERRLLYVAMTRAKVLLYLSYPLKNSRHEQTIISPFLSSKGLKPHFSEKGPSFKTSVVHSVAQILNRQAETVANTSAAMLGLDSLEDDLWPLGGDEIDSNSSKWDNWDGTHHFTLGQQAPKRQRIDDGQELGINSMKETWKPAYSTTMAQSMTFSATSATLQSGFVTAASHMEVLSKQSANSVLEKARTRDPKSSTSLGVDNTRVQKGAKGASSRNSDGQGRLMDFFGKPRVSAKPQSLDVPPNLDSSRVNLLPRESSYKVAKPTTQSLSGDSARGGILPSLANHRLGSSLLCPPPRQKLDTQVSKQKAYVFLSSSPTRPERLIHDAENFTEPIKFQALAATPVVQKPISQPVQTMHITSMQRMNTLNVPPRKTLGVRRSMNGWANRGGHSFAPPRMSKPS